MKLIEAKFESYNFGFINRIRQNKVQISEGYCRFADTYIERYDIYITDILDKVYQWVYIKRDIFIAINI